LGDQLAPLPGIGEGKAITGYVEDNAWFYCGKARAGKRLLPSLNDVQNQDSVRAQQFTKFEALFAVSG
jgi:hypothetical protein